jgi:hypothetical protein
MSPACLTPHPPAVAALRRSTSHRKSGLPDLRSVVRNRGKPRLRGGGMERMPPQRRWR